MEGNLFYFSHKTITFWKKSRFALKETFFFYDFFQFPVSSSNDAVHKNPFVIDVKQRVGRSDCDEICPFRLNWKAQSQTNDREDSFFALFTVVRVRENLLKFIVDNFKVVGILEDKSSFWGYIQRWKSF